MDQDGTSIDEFFTRLDALFKSRVDKDETIFLTQKRRKSILGPSRPYAQRFKVSLPSREPHRAEAAGDGSGIVPGLHAEGPFPVLVRACNSKGKHKRPAKIKIKTVVQPAELDQFFARYAEVCRGNMAGLKKRDKSKKKRAKRRKRADGEVDYHAP